MEGVCDDEFSSPFGVFYDFLVPFWILNGEITSGVLGFDEPSVDH